MTHLVDLDDGTVIATVEGRSAVVLLKALGTYVSSRPARWGARPLAVDPAAGQLAIASEMQVELGRPFPLVRAAGEQVFFRTGPFDQVISEHGAAIWADPYRWIPESARLLRPRGHLVVLGNSTVAHAVRT